LGVCACTESPRQHQHGKNFVYFNHFTN
jgi:hypothetical protein